MKFSHRDRGFSLIEALLALVIITFTMVGITNLLVNSSNVSKRNVDRLNYSLIARGQMESLLGAGPAALNAYYEKAKNEAGTAYYLTDEAMKIEYMRLLTAAKLEKDSAGNLRITVGLTKAEDATAEETVGEKADFTLSETLRGGAQK